MPMIVLRNKNPKVGPWVVDVPDGTDPQRVADAWSAEGWILTAEPPAPAGAPLNLEPPAEPVNPEGN